LCFLHVGTHKTGTTSIQAFLRDNEARFARRGVLVPRAGRGEDRAGHHNLSQELLGASGFVEERGGLAALVAELARSDASRAVISSEDFSLLSRSHQALVTLRDAIGAAGFAPTIIIYFRPQVSYCVSIYAEIVKNGNLKPFSRYLDELREHGSFLWNGVLGPLCRYDVLFERFAAVFGAEAIIVRRYRSSAPRNALLRSFARIVTGRRITFGGFTFPAERFNPSLSFRRVLAALGAAAPEVDMRFAPLNLRETLALAREFAPANISLARRSGTWIPPVELDDVLLALPWRKSLERSHALGVARAALDASGRGVAPGSPITDGG
jgi:hypothetical protein